MRNSTEYRGVGQSGYTSGRGEHDLALERDMQARNACYPKDGEEEEQIARDLEVDDRWSGRGGPIPADEPYEPDEPQ
jgi:hypothetical protein